MDQLAAAGLGQDLACFTCMYYQLGNLQLNSTRRHYVSLMI